LETSPEDTRDGDQLKSAACQHEEIGSHASVSVLDAIPTNRPAVAAESTQLRTWHGWNAASICRECPEVSGPFFMPAHASPVQSSGA